MIPVVRNCDCRPYSRCAPRRCGCGSSHGRWSGRGRAAPCPCRPCRIAAFLDHQPGRFPRSRRADRRSGCDGTASRTPCRLSHAAVPKAGDSAFIHPRPSCGARRRGTDLRIFVHATGFGAVSRKLINPSLNKRSRTWDASLVSETPNTRLHVASSPPAIHSSCHVGLNRISLISTFSDWLMAKAMARAKEFAGIAASSGSQRIIRFQASSMAPGATRVQPDTTRCTLDRARFRHGIQAALRLRTRARTTRQLPLSVRRKLDKLAR